MAIYFQDARVGLRDKDTGKLIAAYPESVSGKREDVQDKVFFWYYQQGCEAEHILEKCYLDMLTDGELKSFS